MNLLATLFLSQGVPMILGGDELSRTQGGNNNAYCQDNEISWFDWERVDGELFEFTRQLIDLRHKHPVFRRRLWFQGEPVEDDKQEDIVWFHAGGERMTSEHWNEEHSKSLALFLNGQGIATPDARGERIIDDSFYLAFNAHFEAVDFKLPPTHWGARWRVLLDTMSGFTNDDDASILKAGETVRLEGRSLIVLIQENESNP